MIRSITRKKPDEEINRLLEGVYRIFIIGCGTCTTLTHTGGEPEVSAMADYLASQGKLPPAVMLTGAGDEHFFRIEHTQFHTGFE